MTKLAHAIKKIRAIFIITTTKILRLLYQRISRELASHSATMRTTPCRCAQCLQQSVVAGSILRSWPTIPTGHRLKPLPRLAHKHLPARIGAQLRDYFLAEPRAGDAHHLVVQRVVMHFQRDGLQIITSQSHSSVHCAAPQYKPDRIPRLRL